MLIKENRLRSIIRSIIKEAIRPKTPRPAIYDQIREIDSEICALINNQSVHYFYLPEMKLIQVNLVSEP